MDHHFIARINSGVGSGQCKTAGEALDWAKAAMAKDAKVVFIPIYEVHTVVEREAPPISTRRIHPVMMPSERQPGDIPDGIIIPE